MIQWQCTCGAWIDMTHLAHVHKGVTRLPSLSDMHRMRMEGRDNEALLEHTELDKTTWKPEFPRREKPL